MYILYIIILFLKRTEQIVVETEIRNTKIEASNKRLIRDVSYM